MASSTLEHTRSVLRDFVWRQSTVANLLRCPRRFELEHVLQVPLDHEVSGYAAFLGTADHAALAHVLRCANAGEVPARTALLEVSLAAFAEAIEEAHARGETTDPEGVERALSRLEEERLDRVARLAEDQRVHAVHWRQIEHEETWVERGLTPEGRVYRRHWKCTLDAAGVAKRTIRDFGADGRDPVDIYQGEGLLVDWKTGADTPLGGAERRLNLQLGVYSGALARCERSGPRSLRAFIGQVQDADQPKAPTDDAGKRIPKRLPKAINPEWARAAGLSLEEAAATKGRPKGISKGVSKWLPEQENPAFVAACSKPKGPVFRECRVHLPLVMETVDAAIRQAEAGLFPASGALTGQCGRCPYSRVCADSTGTETDHQHQPTTESARSAA